MVGKYRKNVKGTNSIPITIHKTDRIGKKVIRMVAKRFQWNGEKKKESEGKIFKENLKLIYKAEKSKTMMKSGSLCKLNLKPLRRLRNLKRLKNKNLNL